MGLLTASNLKTELAIATEDTTYDTLLALLASSVQSLFDELTGRTVERTTFTEYYSSHDRQSKVYLKNRPVISITSLYDDPDWDYAVGDLIAAEDYTYNAEKGIVKYDSFFFEGFNNIKITYVAGYNSDTFPASWKQIWTRQACHWFREAKNKQHGLLSVSVSGGSISKMALKDGMLEDFKMLCDLEANEIVQI